MFRNWNESGKSVQKKTNKICKSISYYLSFSFSLPVVTMRTQTAFTRFAQYPSKRCVCFFLLFSFDHSILFRFSYFFFIFYMFFILLASLYCLTRIFALIDIMRLRHFNLLPLTINLWHRKKTHALFGEWEKNEETNKVKRCTLFFYSFCSRKHHQIIIIIIVSCLSINRGMRINTNQHLMWRHNSSWRWKRYIHMFEL